MKSNSLESPAKPGMSAANKFGGASSYHAVQSRLNQQTISSSLKKNPHTSKIGQVQEQSAKKGPSCFAQRTSDTPSRATSSFALNANGSTKVKEN